MKRFSAVLLGVAVAAAPLLMGAMSGYPSRPRFQTVTVSTSATVAGEPVTTESSGNFVASFDTACTTTPTVTFGYVKVGNQVTLLIKSIAGFPCTGDSTSFATTGTPVPVALRPLASRLSPVLIGCADNGTNVQCLVNVQSSGNVSLTLVNGGSTAAWTAAGNRGAGASAQLFSYYISNP
jgi:hypothetical protein